MLVEAKSARQNITMFLSTGSPIQRLIGYLASAILVLPLCACLDHADNPSVTSQSSEDGWVAVNTPDGRINPLNHEDRVNKRRRELHDPAERALRKQETNSPNGGVSAFKVELDADNDEQGAVIWVPTKLGEASDPSSSASFKTVRISKGCFDTIGTNKEDTAIVIIDTIEKQCADGKITHLLILNQGGKVLNCGGCDQQLD